MRPITRRLTTLGISGLLSLGIFSGTANAVPVSVWDRLAQCESSGRWHINTGNGYYGGVQFSKSSWDWVGGHHSAAYPHQASKMTQIHYAEKLLRKQGWANAWPVCSRKIGVR